MTRRRRWAVGDIAYLEYHCTESRSSGDAPAWLRSHQLVTVTEGLHDVDPPSPGVYTVRFPDGLEWGVFPDEMFTDPRCFRRPDPPSPDQDRFRVHGKVRSTLSLSVQLSELSR